MSAWKTVRIYIEFRAAGKTYECLLPAGMMCGDAIREIFELARPETEDFWQPDERTLIYEKNSGILCDPHVSLNSAGACDGMILEVY